MGTVFKGVAPSNAPERRSRSEALKEKRKSRQQETERFETGLFSVEGMVNENGNIDEVQLEEKLLELAQDQMTDWSLVNNERIDWVEKTLTDLARDTDADNERNALEWALSEIQEIQQSREEVRAQISAEEFKDIRNAHTTVQTEVQAQINAEQAKAIKKAAVAAQEIAGAAQTETAAFEEKQAQLEAMVNELGEKEDRYNAMSWFKRKMSAEGRTLARDIKELQKKSDELSAEIAGGPQINVTEQAA